MIDDISKKTSYDSLNDTDVSQNHISKEEQKKKNKMTHEDIKTNQQQTLEFVKLTPEQKSARKKRNIAIAIALISWIIIVFLITILKVKSGVFMRDL